LASFKSYLSNNAPFLNAREKWQTVSGDLSDARRRWESAKESDSNYQELLADYKLAQNTVKAAKAVMDAAETAARKTFNEEQKQKDTEKQKKKEKPIQQQITTLEAEETKYKNAGLQFPADQQEKLNDLRNQITVAPTPITGTGTTTGTTGTTGTGGATTGSTPIVLSFEEFIKGVDSNPALLAKVREDLGVKSTDPKLDIVTYQAILKKEQEIVTLEGIRGPIDRLTYFAETKGKGTGTTATTTISPRSDATVYINNALKRVGIAREATPEEIDNLIKVLNDAEGRFKTTKVGGVTKDLLGDRTQFIANLITTGKYVDPNTGKPIKGLKEDIKLAAGVLGNLSKSAQTLKADTRSLSVQTLQSTANANGVTLSPEQLNQYALDIQNGKDIKVIQSQIRNLASIGMPDSVKKLLAEGTDLDTIYSPYKSQMAAVLELNPNEINLEDSVLRSAIGPDKELPLYEFKKMLKKDSRWQYTNNAREEVSNKVLKVLQDFGFQG
jgi:hypothetical protein